MTRISEIVKALPVICSIVGQATVRTTDGKESVYPVVMLFFAVPLCCQNASGACNRLRAKGLFEGAGLQNPFFERVRCYFRCCRNNSEIGVIWPASRRAWAAVFCACWLSSFE